MYIIIRFWTRQHFSDPSSSPIHSVLEIMTPHSICTYQLSSYNTFILYILFWILFVVFFFYNIISCELPYLKVLWEIHLIVYSVVFWYYVYHLIAKQWWTPSCIMVITVQLNLKYCLISFQRILFVVYFVVWNFSTIWLLIFIDESKIIFRASVGGLHALLPMAKLMLGLPCFLSAK